MLQESVFPQLQEREDWGEMLFMQDGAPPHYAAIVKRYLEEQLPQRWIGRGGPVSWPPRSPDLTPMDFFLWGKVKNEVFSRSPCTLEDLRQYITEALAAINRQLCTKVCRSMKSRLEECMNVDGWHFEHLKK